MKTINKIKVQIFLEKLAKMNPDVTFKYKTLEDIIIDSSSNKDVSVRNLNMPKGYYSNCFLGSDAALICENTSKNPITAIKVENSLENTDINNYKSYKYKKTALKGYLNIAKNKLIYIFGKGTKYTNEAKDEKTSTPELTKEERANNFEKSLKKLQEASRKPLCLEKEVIVINKNYFKIDLADCLDDIKNCKTMIYKTNTGKFHLVALKEGFQVDRTLLSRMLNVDNITCVKQYNEDSEAYKYLRLNSIKKEYNDVKESIRIVYDNLTAEEKECADLALKDGVEEITIRDKKFQDKSAVKNFLLKYKMGTINLKKLISEYSKISCPEKTDYSKYSFNELKKEVTANKQLLTINELNKRKKSRLTKAELLIIMNRIEAEKQTAEVVKKLNLK